MFRRTSTSVMKVKPGTCFQYPLLLSCPVSVVDETSPNISRIRLIFVHLFIRQVCSVWEGSFTSVPMSGIQNCNS